MKAIENGKSHRKFIACQDDLNNLWLLLHRFQMFAFSVNTIRLLHVLYGNDIIITIPFSNLWDRFQKLSFSVKTIIVFESFRVNVIR